MVAGGGAPVLPCPLVVPALVLPVVAGSQGAREPGSLGGVFPALSRIIREPEGAWTPGRPRKAQGGPEPAVSQNHPATVRTEPKQGKGARRTPIYR